MSNKIDWTQLRTASAKAAEEAKAAAIATERESLRQYLATRPDHTRTTLRDLVERVEALEKYLGIIPLDAEA